MQHKQQQSLHRKPGPHIYAAITHGFHDHFSLPTGGGRKGSILGSLRPSPTGHASAWSIGTSSKDTCTRPPSSSFIALLRRLHSIQNLCSFSSVFFLKRDQSCGPFLLTRRLVTQASLASALYVKVASAMKSLKDRISTSQIYMLTKYVSEGIVTGNFILQLNDPFPV